MAFVIPVVPIPIAGFLPGCFGISYDIATHPTENLLPDGWESYRSRTYEHLRDILQGAGFIRRQKSDWSHPLCTSVWAWTTMWNLPNIPPPGKFETTVSGLKMHLIPFPLLCDVTNMVRLGGIHANILRGPSPAQLVMNAVAAPPPGGPGLLVPAVNPPAVGFNVPHNTIPSPTSTFVGHWLM